MRAATAEVISLRYMLRSLGIPVSTGTPTNLYSDNYGVI